MFDFNALDHQAFMREALKEAECALQEGERPIGAVVVYDGKIVGRGHAQHKTRHSEIAHAELNAMLDAKKLIHDHIHDGIVLYTTVEPCVMCLGAVVMSDIDHIVFGLADKNINPSQMLAMPYVRRHIKNYVGGVLEAESLALMEKFDPRELRWMLGEH